jgi:hypothetical protein
MRVLLLIFICLWKVNGRSRPVLTYGCVRISIKMPGALLNHPRRLAGSGSLRRRWRNIYAHRGQRVGSSLCAEAVSCRGPARRYLSYSARRRVVCYCRSTSERLLSVTPERRLSIIRRVTMNNGWGKSSRSYQSQPWHFSGSINCGSPMGASPTKSTSM